MAVDDDVELGVHVDDDVVVESVALVIANLRDDLVMNYGMDPLAYCAVALLAADCIDWNHRTEPLVELAVAVGSCDAFAFDDFVIHFDDELATFDYETLAYSYLDLVAICMHWKVEGYRIVDMAMIVA